MSEYYIGLDIGTDSVGWAVVDSEYRLIKRHGKSLWGVRLFPEAKKAEERRGFRTARRRLERRNQRIDWLRRIFSEEIAKVDPAFFLRMDESKFMESDKRLTKSGYPLGKYTLFADPNYCDQDYHREFPTIYHLRRALLTENRPFDVRLVYLAIHHILKKRGHFLFGDMDMEEISFEECFEELHTILSEEYELTLEVADLSAFREALLDRSLGITLKKNALRKSAGVSKADRQLGAVLDLLAGAKIKASEVCGLELSKDDDISFTFKNDFENVEPALGELLGDDMRLILTIKKLYDWSLLEELHSGEKYISFAKVRVYEQHQNDLCRLKELFRPDKGLFNEMFRTAKDKLDNYPAYSGHRAENYRCDYGMFCTYARKQIKELMPKLDAKQILKAQAILSEMEAGTFLPKQTNKDNGVIPHQLHEQELRIILERAGAYLPFLNVVDESGLSRSEQILEVFRFRIPYYVGPLNPNSAHSWVVRTDEKIMPWNFERVVDRHASAEKFITRMTATCNYIGEPVLPKDSLLYSRFIVLNAINKLQINGHPISVAAKQRIFDEHILAKSHATGKSIKDFLLANGMMEKNDVLSGIDEGFRAALAGYQVFRQILSRGNNFRMVEDIIKHIVLYGEDRRLLEEWLVKKYGEALSVEDIGYILRNRGRFNGWGNLSEEFLTKIEHVDETTGEVSSIIDMLWNTNYNLMELLSGQYGFTKSIEAWCENKYMGQKPTLNDVLADRYASPGIRKAIHQTMGLISEIEKIMRGQPKRVFVEVTRGEGAKERTVSRKQKLNELYAACKKEAPELYEQLQDCDEAALRSTKLYLYFTQMGKCMYSGETIDLSRLAIDYDIDHIYPQKQVKDDSMDNRVLVKKQLNAEKSDKYPIEEAIRSQMRPYWGMLRERKLISEEKYRRLTRNTDFDDNELSGFIARQLVETSQSCKIVAELLKNRYASDDRVVYVKAGNVASFRQDQRVLPDGTQVHAGVCKNIETSQDPVFIKCREVNDFHHAKDAYLNIVVGNVYHVKFTRNPINFIQKRQPYNMKRMFDFDVVRGDECAWKKGADGSIATVRSVMRRNDVIVTRYAYEVTGGLFDQQIVPKGNGQAMIKRSDSRMTTDKFGGYNKISGAYFILVEHIKGTKRVRSIEPVYIMYRAMYEQNAIAYCENVLELENPRVLIPRIKMDSLLSFDGFRMYVSGRTGQRIVYKNANQLILSPKEIRYIKRISKYLERCRYARGNVAITAFDKITAEDNCALYQVLLDKLKNKCYSIRYDAPAKTLDNGSDCFVGLSIADQCRILLQILNLFGTNAAKADLKLLGGSGQAGVLSTSKNLDGYANHEFMLIHQSITGVFEQKIDLLGERF